MKLLLIGYYHLLDGFLGAADALRNKFNYEIEFFPMNAYNDKYGNNKIHLLKSFVERKINPKDILTSTLYSGGDPPHVILWWNFNIEAHEIQLIKKINNSIIHIFYSWDDPYWVELQNQKENKNESLKFIDIAYSCCNKSLKFYFDSGVKYAYYTKPGFDPKIHFPTETNTKSYDCDISIICTNLYNSPNDNGKCINRLGFLNQIIKDGSIKLNIYGPENFKKMFPRNYVSSVTFADTCKVFNKSKINICTHARQKSGDMYINERTCQILGAGGLLYIDNVAGLDKILDINSECVVINESDHVNQIKKILGSYSEFEVIKKKGYERAMKDLTWDIWAETIHNGICTYYKDISLTIIDSDIKICSNFTSSKIVEFDQKGLDFRSIYLICILIRNTKITNINYLKVLSSLCKKHNLNINNFLETNIKHIINSDPIMI